MIGAGEKKIGISGSEICVRRKLHNGIKQAIYKFLLPPEKGGKRKLARGAIKAGNHNGTKISIGKEIGATTTERTKKNKKHLAGRHELLKEEKEKKKV